MRTAFLVCRNIQVAPVRVVTNRNFEVTVYFLACRNVLAGILVTIFFSSCYSYKIYPKEYRNFIHTGEKKVAYIQNCALTKELQILRASSIFTLSSDSMNAAVSIRLYPLKRDFVCATGAELSLVTLGQLPLLLPDRYQYRFDEIHRNDTIQQQFELKIATRYWFWDVFVFKKKFDKKAGQTLAANYYQH